MLVLPPASRAQPHGRKCLPSLQICTPQSAEKEVMKPTRVHTAFIFSVHWAVCLQVLAWLTQSQGSRDAGFGDKSVWVQISGICKLCDLGWLFHVSEPPLCELRTAAFCQGCSKNQVESR